MVGSAKGRNILFLLVLLLLIAGEAVACFGPKLFYGVGNGAEEELRFALVSLYVKEKTGVEMNRVELAGKGVVAEIAAERIDLGFAATGEGSVLRLPDGSLLFCGQRLRDDLQFTTVLPALKKLQAVVDRADWRALVARVGAGEGALAVARAFFKVQGAL